jgi:hypothetical protein
VHQAVWAAPLGLIAGCRVRVHPRLSPKRGHQKLLAGIWACFCLHLNMMVHDDPDSLSLVDAPSYYCQVFADSSRSPTTSSGRAWFSCCPKLRIVPDFTCYDHLPRLVWLTNLAPQFVSLLLSTINLLVRGTLHSSTSHMVNILSSRRFQTQ